MLAMNTTETPFTFGLDARQSNRVLELAARACAVVVLTPRTDEKLQLWGPIEAQSDESLWISLDEANIGYVEDLQSVCCDGVLELGDARYLFDTNILAFRGSDDCMSVEVASPCKIRVIQRRRFCRAQLQESSEIELLDTNAAPADGDDLRSHLGAMLNVSVEGLACRVPTETSDAFRPDQELQVRFTVLSDPEPFEFTALLKSKTPGGTPGMTVLGLHFKHSPNESAYHRLQAALERLA